MNANHPTLFDQAHLNRRDSASYTGIQAAGIISREDIGMSGALKTLDKTAKSAPPSKLKNGKANGHHAPISAANINVGRKPRLLDMFCCAGGAGWGYHLAGFDVVGVDIDPQPNNPQPFIQTDAMKLDLKFIRTFDAVHASPPCQHYSDLAKRNGNAHEWPDLVGPTRDMLVASGLPYIIENVEGAPLLDPVLLCGTMFPGLRVIRHRLFESNVKLTVPEHTKKHPLVHTFDKRKNHYGKTNDMVDFVQVTGGGNCTMAAAKEALGITWMKKKVELNESIPPKFTEYLGKQLVAHLAAKSSLMGTTHG